MIPHDIRAEQQGWDGGRFQASLLHCLRHVLPPRDELVVSVVRTANETDRRLFGTPLRFNREVTEDPRLLGIVDHVGLVVFHQQLAPLLLGVGSDILYVVEANGAGCRGGTSHFLQQVHVVVGDFFTQIFVEARDVGVGVDNLEADGGADHAPIRLFGRLDFHEPTGHAALVRHESEQRRLAEDCAEHFHARGVAVGTDSEGGVAVVHRGRFRPGHVGPRGRLIADLVHVTGTAAVVQVRSTKLSMNPIEVPLHFVALVNDPHVRLVVLDVVKVVAPRIDSVGCVGLQPGIGAFL